ncbi:DUF4384 domain-containing protein [Candidatus Bipolaricaulota bacterium]|nr:DUF4384 domain-containing protein [Candidatus Bipolaricaulota bacterium]
MNAKRIVLLLTMAFLVGASAIAALPQSQVNPLGLVITPDPLPLQASVWTDKAVYSVGETATISFAVNQPAYVYIYDIQPDGVVRQIYPNAYSQNNYVAAGSHSLPDGPYNFTVAPPTGVEQLQLVASLSPLALASNGYGEPFPLVAPNAIDAGNSIRIQIMGMVPQPMYVTAWTSFTINPQVGYGYMPPSYVPPSYVPPTPMPPTYPPYVLWSVPDGTWFWWGGQWVFGSPAGGMYWTYGWDGTWRIHIRLHFGSGD